MGREYTGTSVYRLYDKDDNLLYVGVANRPSERWGTHAGTHWWPLVVHREIVRYATREKALRVEAAAIRTENPLYNQLIPNPDGSIRGAKLRADSPALAQRTGPRGLPRKSKIPQRQFRAPQVVWDLYKDVVWRRFQQTPSEHLNRHIRRMIRLHGSDKERAVLDEP